MKSQFKSGITLATVCGLSLGLGVVAFRAQADQWDKMTIMTVDQPVEVENTLLEPGSYMFKLANTDRHIVQVFTSDRRQLINTFMAIPNYRLQPTGNTRFMFWETPPGTARALRAWFYPGDNFGQEFRYPTLLAYENPIVNTTPVASMPVTSSETQVATVQENDVQRAEPALQQRAEEQPKEEQKEEVIIAQNNPPAVHEGEAQAENAGRTSANESASNAASSNNGSQNRPKSLPKTASVYPLAGLAGLLSIGLYGLLRLKRTA